MRRRSVLKTIRAELNRGERSLDELSAACRGKRVAVITKLHYLKEQGEAIRVDGTGRAGRYCHPVWAIPS